MTPIVERLREEAKALDFDQVSDLLNEAASLIERRRTSEAEVLAALAREGIPPDVQELLTIGNPTMGVRPGALKRAL